MNRDDAENFPMNPSRTIFVIAACVT